MPLGMSSSQVVTVAMTSPILSSVGMASVFVPHPVGHAGAPTRSSPLSPPMVETAASERPPSVEGALIPYCDEGGGAWFVLNDS